MSRQAPTDDLAGAQVDDGREVIAGPSYPQDPAHQAQRELPAMILDELESHGCSLAKKAVAFFKISFSRISWRFCFSSSLTRTRSVSIVSACSWGCCP